eukprot:1528821-Rhodomonas_salina.1
MSGTDVVRITTTSKAYATVRICTTCFRSAPLSAYTMSGTGLAYRAICLFTIRSSTYAIFGTSLWLWSLRDVTYQRPIRQLSAYVYPRMRALPQLVLSSRLGY